MRNGNCVNSGRQYRKNRSPEPDVWTSAQSLDLSEIDSTSIQYHIIMFSPGRLAPGKHKAGRTVPAGLLISC